ncbi:sulfurtransferase TusA family protein [Parvularcula oceani]|uniref:sulfurtransferase TusA family protein n=1 Tax=Parvularcula oceani TaxID=1247963 RepID=UPI00192E3A59|nr:sulfurtransferase TusA family protein [Parvularcula oceani]
MSEPAWPVEADRHIDALGLRCPLPVLKLEAALRALPPGALVAIRTDDPIANVDIPHAAREGGHGCERIGTAGGVTVFVIRQTADSPMTFP